jgi:alkylation response protein AidB-like acyl-CoA dehydrogenase
MIEWSEEHKAFRDVVRRFVDSEIRPHLDELEHGDRPPYDILRKLVRTLGIAEFQKQRFEAQLAAERAGTDKTKSDKPSSSEGKPSQARADASAMQLILVIELCRVCPGMVTAMGVSSGLTTGTILSRGTLAQKERFVPELLTLEKIGAWAITEPGSGSDAFGAMKATCRREGNDYLLSGQKTFITNGPYADTIVFICKLDDGETAPEKRKVLSFILDRGMPGLVQSKPLRKMGQHSSPTGELFLEDVRVPKDRLLGETEDVSYRTGARDTFSSERSGTPAMALGIVEECLARSVDYAKTRVQFGRPIGEFQLIQQKLALMEVARMNIQNLVFRQIELAAHGKRMSFAEASAGKLYSAQAAMAVALEAVQVFGGNGYMAEHRVEQLCRDAKVLQIYAGTDEIQTSQIARDLLSR